MGKAPAFQFYPADYRKDPALRMASWATRGMWMEVLCCMWDAVERGELQGSVSHFCRLIGCAEDEFGAFLAEAETLRFADVSWDCHGNVTLRNRRMIRDERRRKDWAIRQARHRAADKSPDGHDDVTPSHAHVTPMSPGSSSSDQERTPISDSGDLSDLVSQDPEIGVFPRRDSEAPVAAGDDPIQKPTSANGKPSQPVDPWDPDDAEFVAVLKAQPVFKFELLDRPTWWANLSEMLNGISPAWTQIQFKAMQNWLITNPHRHPVKSSRGALRFIQHWLVNAREQERRQAKWQESPRSRA